MGLFDVGINERSITHKFAEYLQQEFPDYNVDCEYNRHGFDKKILEIPKNEYPSWDDKEAKTVYPDIVIHKRKTNSDNLVVIEVKKSNSSQSLRKFDEKKLQVFTNKTYGCSSEMHYCYDYGLFIEFDLENLKSHIEIFENGIEIDEFEFAVESST